MSTDVDKPQTQEDPLAYLEPYLCEIVLRGRSEEEERRRRWSKMPPDWQEALERGEQLLKEAVNRRAEGHSDSFLSPPIEGVEERRETNGSSSSLP